MCSLLPRTLALSVFMYSVSKRINVGCMYIPSKVISVRMRSAISSSLYKTNPYAQVGLRLSHAPFSFTTIFFVMSRESVAQSANAETISRFYYYTDICTEKFYQTNRFFIKSQTNLHHVPSNTEVRRCSTRMSRMKID